jgi:hypothetical protein
MPEPGDLYLRRYALNHQLLELIGVFEPRSNLQRRVSVQVGVRPEAFPSHCAVYPADLTCLYGAVWPH